MFCFCGWIFFACRDSTPIEAGRKTSWYKIIMRPMTFIVQALLFFSKIQKDNNEIKNVWIHQSTIILSYWHRYYNIAITVTSSLIISCLRGKIISCPPIVWIVLDRLSNISLKKDTFVDYCFTHYKYSYYYYCHTRNGRIIIIKRSLRYVMYILYR